jgi:hypothetical protein
MVIYTLKNGVFYANYGSAVTTTAGYFLALKMRLITGNKPVVYWISAVLVIVIVMIVLGLGIVLPTNLRVYFLSLERTNLTCQEFRNL